MPFDGNERQWDNGASWEAIERVARRLYREWSGEDCPQHPKSGWARWHWFMRAAERELLNRS